MISRCLILSGKYVFITFYNIQNLWIRGKPKKKKQHVAQLKPLCQAPKDTMISGSSTPRKFKHPRKYAQ